MAMRILVPLDGSRFSEQAVSSAYRIALLSRATVHLVTVIKAGRHVSALAGIAPNPIVNALKEEADDYLEQQAGRAPLGIATRTAVRLGPDSVAEQLGRYIEEAGINFVVMSTHGRTGLGRFWIGSEADALVRTINVPVLLLRPHKGETGPEVDWWRAHRILIPLDGSERAEAILESAVELGWLSRARYTLLQVLRPPVLATYADAVSSQVDAHEIEHEVQLARDYLENVANRLRGLRMCVDTAVIVHGNIAHAIVEYALENDVDTIALGTHGRSGWSRLALGSVTQDVVHNAGLAVLVIRSSETEADIDHSKLTAAAC